MERELIGFRGVESKVQHHVYSSFGKLLAVEDQNGNDIAAAPILAVFFSYTGREFDQESNLYNFRTRYYMPEIGRFLEKDPDKGRSVNPITFLSKYIYVLNNPIYRIDPSGTISLKSALLIPTAAIFGPLATLAIINTEFGQKQFDLSKRDVNRINKGAIIAAAVGVTVATGGSAGGVIATAAVAGAFNAAISTNNGQFFDNFLTGASSGAVSSAFFGGLGAASGSQNFVDFLQSTVTGVSLINNPDFVRFLEASVGARDGDPFPGIE